MISICDTLATKTLKVSRCLRASQQIRASSSLKPLDGSWTELAKKQLKGKDPNLLKKTTSEEIEIKPIYTKDDIADLDDHSLPGQVPRSYVLHINFSFCTFHLSSFVIQHYFCFSFHSHVDLIPQCNFPYYNSLSLDKSLNSNYPCITIFSGMPKNRGQFVNMLDFLLLKKVIDFIEKTSKQANKDFLWHLILPHIEGNFAYNNFRFDINKHSYFKICENEIS